MKIGLDIGSTTIKCVVLNDNDESYINPMNATIPKLRKKFGIFFNMYGTMW